MARMHNVCRILKESSKGPESVSGYNIEMVCERLAIGDTVLHKQIATLHESRAIGDSVLHKQIATLHESRAIGDTVLHKQIATLHESRAIGDTVLHRLLICMISGSRREVSKHCSFLGYFLLFLYSLTLRMGPTGCPETSEKRFPLI